MTAAPSPIRCVCALTHDRTVGASEPYASATQATACPRRFRLLRHGHVVRVHAHAEVPEVHSEIHGPQAIGGPPGSGRGGQIAYGGMRLNEWAPPAFGCQPCPRDDDLGAEHRLRDRQRAAPRVPVIGGTFVDTAHGYSDGASEEFLGRLIDEAGPRRRHHLHQGRHLAAVRDPGGGHLRFSLLSQLDTSLERLGTDHVDLWLVHTWSDETPLSETARRWSGRSAPGGPLRGGVELLRVA